MSDDHHNNANNKKVEKEAAEIKVTINEAQKYACIFLLVVLRSILNEQITAKQLKHDVSDYIYQASSQEPGYQKRVHKRLNNNFG